MPWFWLSLSRVWEIINTPPWAMKSGRCAHGVIPECWYVEHRNASFAHLTHRPVDSLGFTAGVRLPYEWLYIMSPELLLVPFVGMACLNDLHRGLCMDLEPTFVLLEFIPEACGFTSWS